MARIIAGLGPHGQGYCCTRATWLGLLLDLGYMARIIAGLGPHGQDYCWTRATWPGLLLD